MNIEVSLPAAHPAQQKVLDSKARFRVMIAGRRFGKSLIVQRECIEKIIHSQQVGYICPTFDLCQDFYDEIIDLIPTALIKNQNKSRLTIKLITGGTLKFFSGEALQRLRGKKFHHLVIDEAAYIPDLEKEYTKAIRPCLSDYKGTCIFISTPNGLDYFHKLYKRGSDKRFKEFESFHFTTYDNPYISRKEIQAAKDELPEAVFEQEYLAIPLADASNPFGKHINKNIIEVLSTKPAVAYGIDLAKYNDWTSVTGIDEDGAMCYHDRFQMGWNDTIERLKQLPDDVYKLIDKTGVGDVIYEQLQGCMQNIIGFQFTAQSKPVLIFSLIKEVEIGGVNYNQITADEMKIFEYKRNHVTGNYSFNAKQGAGYHDDTIISLALALECKKKYTAASFTLYSPDDFDL